MAGAAVNADLIAEDVAVAVSARLKGDEETDAPV